MSSERHPDVIKGRGAQSAHVPDRFGLAQREADGDWLDTRAQLGEDGQRLRTNITTESPRTILSRNTSPDIPFDRSINMYRGCEHGCIYCYARPTHAYLDLSPGLDFETQLFVKPNAPELLRKELAKRGYVAKPIALGTNTDPYQPIERTYRITRQILQICLECRHPVTITTKSDRVIDDLAILQELAQRNLVAVAISVTTLDAKLSSTLEPRAASPQKRMAALGRLAQANIPTHINIAPIIPAITDAFMEDILRSAAEIGVQSASWIALRLPHEVAPLFREWLEVHFPDRAQKVMHIVQSMRGGRDNDSTFFRRMKPDGVWADLFRARFRAARKRYGIELADFSLDSGGFIPPNLSGQLQLI